MGILGDLKGFGGDIGEALATTARKVGGTALRGIQEYNRTEVIPRAFLLKMAAQHPETLWDSGEFQRRVRDLGIDPRVFGPTPIVSVLLPGSFAISRGVSALRGRGREAGQDLVTMEEDVRSMGGAASLVLELASDPVTYAFGIGALVKAFRAPTLLKGLTQAARSPELTSIPGYIGGSIVGEQVGGDTGAFVGSIAGALAAPVSARVVLGSLPHEVPAIRLGVSVEGEAGKFPTIRETEAMAGGPKLAPEVRAQFVGEADPGLYRPGKFQEVVDTALAGADRNALRFWEKVATLPGMRPIVGFINRRALVTTDPGLGIRMDTSVFVQVEGGRARLAVDRWRNGLQYLGPDKDGYWRAVEIRPGAKIPKQARQHPGDILEHPEDYILSPQQQTVVDEAHGLLENMFRSELEEGVDVLQVVIDGAGAYFPRIVREGLKGDKPARAFIRRTFGAKQGHIRRRAFGDIREGLGQGFKYETDAVVLMKVRLEAGVQAIADHNAIAAFEKLPGVLRPTERVPETIKAAFQTSRLRLRKVRSDISAHLKENRAALRSATKAARKAVRGVLPGQPKLGGFPGLEKEFGVLARTIDDILVPDLLKVEFKTAFREHVQATRAIRAAVERSRRPRLGEVLGPRNRIIPAELAKQLEDFISPGAPRSIGVDAVLSATQLIRAARTTADSSAMMVQGGLFLFRNPVAWAKTSVYSLGSFAGDPIAYVAKNYDVMDELIRFGAGLRPTEFLFLEKGLTGVVLRTPLIGKGARGFNRMFEWFIVIGQTEMWKGIRTTAKTPAERAALAAVVAKEFGTLSDAALGLTRTQSAAESAALFAPRFLRANVGLIADAVGLGGVGGVRQKEALRALGQLLGGAMAVTIGLNYAINGELPNLDNPKRADWLSIKLPKGSVNLFGPFMPMMRLVGRTAVSPGAFDSVLGIPVVPTHLARFFKSKAGIPMRAVFDLVAASQGDLINEFGDPLPVTPAQTAEYLARQFFPIGTEQIQEGASRGFYAASLEIFGLRTTPKLEPELFLDAAEEQARATGHAGWEEVPKAERADLIRASPELTRLSEANDKFFDKRRGNRSPEAYAFDAIEQSSRAAEDVLLNLWRGQVLTGKMTRSEWRKQFRERMDSHRHLSNQLLDGIDPDLKRRSGEIQQDYLARVFFAIQPEGFDGKGPIDNVPDGVISEAEWVAWRDARELFWSRFPEAEQFRNYIRVDYPTRSWRSQEMADVHREYRSAQAGYDEFIRIPKYRGLSVEDGQFIDEIRGLGARAATELRFSLAQRGVPTDRVQIPARFSWAFALEKLRGVPLTGRQGKLVQLAILIELKNMQRSLINPERAKFIIQNQLVAAWYPSAYRDAGLRDTDIAKLGLESTPLGESLSQRVAGLT